MNCTELTAVPVCLKNADGTTVSAVAHYQYGRDVDAALIHEATVITDSTGQVVYDLADYESVEVGQCPDQTMCVESQEWTYGIDNTGTNYRWPSACYKLTLSDGSTIEWEQTSASNGGWTPQMEEWGQSIQAAADAAGIAWFVETRYRDPSDPSNLAGGGGFSGPPSLAVSNALTNMLWRYVNIQICPGQPVPIMAEVVEVKDAGGFSARDPGYPLTTDGAVLGPIQKFWLCNSCGKEPVWYLEDGVTLAEEGQIPNCYEPCGTLALTDAPPDRDCSFQFDVACDNNNSDNTVDFTNTITRRATICNGEQIALSYFESDPNDPSALIDYELVGDFVDCATGEPVPLPESVCDVDIEWETVRGYICDPSDSRFGDEVCWAEGRDTCGNRVFEGLLDCPTYYPGKYDGREILAGECQTLSLGQAANGVVNDTYVPQGQGTNTHTIKFSQGGLGNSASQVIQNNAGGSFTVCKLTVNGVVFTYDTRNVVVTGGTPGDGNSISFESTYQNDILGCEDAYDALWNEHIDGNIQSAGYASNCTRLTFVQAGEPAAAGCLEPLEMQPLQVSKDNPVVPPKEYMHVGTLYKLNEVPEGLRVEYWQPSALGGSAVAHDDVTAIFGSALTAHPNSPDADFIYTAGLNIATSSTTFLSAAGFASNAETNGTDQLRMTFWTCGPNEFSLEDANTNTGERGAITINGALAAEDTTDSVSADRAALPPVTIPSGLNKIVVATADLSAWQGYQPDAPDEVSIFAEEPSWSPVQVFKCVDLSGGYVDCDGNAVEVEDKDYWNEAPTVPYCCPTTGTGSVVEPIQAISVRNV